MIRLLLASQEELHGRFTPAWQRRLKQSAHSIPFRGWMASDTPWPFVRASYRQDTGSDPDSQRTWLRLDPSNAMPDINGIRMLAYGEMLNISDAEHQALVQTLRPMLEAQDIALDWPVTSRAYLGLPLTVPQATALRTSPTWDVLGEDLLDYFPGPSGDALAKRLRGLMNELQVELHDHPVNQGRRQRGLPAVNVLWPWTDESTHDKVALLESWNLVSPDSEWRAVWAMGGAHVQHRISVAELDLQGDTVIDLRDQRRCSSLEREWLDPLWAQTRGRMQLQLGDSVFRLSPLDRLKFWR